MTRNDTMSERNAGSDNDLDARSSTKATAPDMAMQPGNSQRSSSGPSAAETSGARLPGVAQPVPLLLVCAGAPDAQLRAAMPTLGAGALVATGLANAHALLADGAHDFAVIAILGASEAGPTLELFETMRANGMAATMLAAPASLSSHDAAILQEAGVEMLTGLTPERQLRSVRERLEAGTGVRPDSARRGERRTELSLEEVASVSEAIARVTAQGRRAMRTGVPVLIEGEPGVGKLALARALHTAGLRRQRPLRQLDAVAVCLGLDEAAARIDVDLERGLINGEAGGSLYLRDIGDWPVQAQAELTELLRRRNARNGRTVTESPLRIFAAARRPLIDLVREGRFRDDLYYLLSVAPLTLPPLRTRRDDIATLASAMLQRLRAGRAATLRGVFPSIFSEDAIRLLAAETWPGNTGQLRARIIRAAHRATGDIIEAADVAPADVPAETNQQPGILLACAPDDFAAGTGDAAWSANQPEAMAASHDFLDIFDGQGDLKPLAEIEAGVIRFAVRHYRGQMSEVSRRLGIGRSTLYRKLKDLDLIQGRDMLETGLAVDSDAARGWPEAAAAQPV